MASPAPSPIPRITARELLDRYDALFLDAYGVLVTHDHPLPGAAALIGHLRDTGRAYFILTNDASRSAAASAARYARLGLPAIPPERIITSGSMVTRALREDGPAGAACVVLGTEDSAAYVREGGGRVVPLHAEAEAETVVVCDEQGFSFLESLDATLSLIVRRLDHGRAVRLLLANPDLVYPAGNGRLGFTGGAVAALLEEALRRRYGPERAPRFRALGKPHAPMFEEAVRRAGTRRAVMIGDQLETDIRGALAAGLDAAFRPGGVSRLEEASLAPGDRPTYVLESLEVAVP
jgi:HAD superfamily hydrolase (TIGR01450 family)